jgi:hypothetical protein
MTEGLPLEIEQYVDTEIRNISDRENFKLKTEDQSPVTAEKERSRSIFKRGYFEKASRNRILAKS